MSSLSALQLTTITGADFGGGGRHPGFLAADAAGAAVTALTIASLAEWHRRRSHRQIHPIPLIATSGLDGDIDIAEMSCAGTGTCYLILITPASW